MSLPYWSVRLAVDERDNGLLSCDPGRAIWQGVRYLSLACGVLDAEEPASVTLELYARDAQTARILAQHRLGELRRRAGVSGRQAPVMWVARLADEAESSLRFLSQAKELIEEEHFEMAVVAAQTHLEVHVRVLIEMIAEESSSDLLRGIMAGRRTWAPHERWLRPVLEVVLSVKLADCPAWAQYVEAHVPRRNAVIHHGQEIDLESAKASLETVSSLWLWLNEAATRPAGPR